MDLKETNCKDVDWMRLIKNIVYWDMVRNVSEEHTASIFIVPLLRKGSMFPRIVGIYMPDHTVT
jgi:hypothetical protein